mgnify:CR=1 FL=1
MSSILSILATLRLKQLSDYSKLFQVSRTALPCCSPTQDNNSSPRLCYPCCPFEPILHRSVIFDKMAAGNFEEFSTLMFDSPVDALLRPNIQGQTPLHVAAEMGDPRFLEELLTKMKLGTKGEDEEGDKVKDQKTNEGTLQEDFEQVEEAEEIEESIDTVNDEQANEKNDEQDVEIEGGFDTKAEQEKAITSDKILCKDSRGRSPIFNACEKNNLRALKLLLEAGFDPDEEDREGWRPIQVAITNETGEKDSHENIWWNNENEEAHECVFHLLSSSGEVRKRTQAIHNESK